MVDFFKIAVASVLISKALAGPCYNQQNQQDQQACESTAGCLYQGNCRPKACSDATIESECATFNTQVRDGCTWNANSNFCQQNECSYPVKTEQECLASTFQNYPDGCVFEQGSCTQASCFNSRNELECTANPIGCEVGANDCAADYTAMSQICFSLSNDQAGCEAQPGRCQWNSKAGNQCFPLDSVCWTHGKNESSCAAEKMNDCSNAFVCNPKNALNVNPVTGNPFCRDYATSATCDGAPKDSATNLGCKWGGFDYCASNTGFTSYLYSLCPVLDSASCGLVAGCEGNPCQTVDTVGLNCNVDSNFNPHTKASCDAMGNECVSVVACREEIPPSCFDSKDANSCAASVVQTKFNLGCEWADVVLPGTTTVQALCKEKAPVICYSQADEQSCNAAVPEKFPCAAVEDDDARDGIRMLKHYNCREENPIPDVPGSVATASYDSDITQVGRGAVGITACEWKKENVYSLQASCNPVLETGCTASQGNEAACATELDFDGTVNCGYVPNCYNTSLEMWPFGSSETQDVCRSLVVEQECTATQGCGWGQCRGQSTYGVDWPCRTHDDDAVACENTDNCMYVSLSYTMTATSPDSTGTYEELTLKQNMCGSCDISGELSVMWDFVGFADQTCSRTFTNSPTSPPTPNPSAPPGSIDNTGTIRKENAFSMSISFGTIAINAKCDLKVTDHPTQAPTSYPTFLNGPTSGGDGYASSSNALTEVVQPEFCQPNGGVFPTRQPTRSPTRPPTNIGDTWAPTSPTTPPTEQPTTYGQVPTNSDVIISAGSHEVARLASVSSCAALVALATVTMLFVWI